ncbi:MAG TPA: type II methionyl aminopeptidase [Acidobacteriota bacterium]|nr:type II methionyl aminopeptidase [Acidobacteriota bacterium]
MNDIYKANFIRAGQLAAQLREFGAKLIVKGASYNDVIQKVNQQIKILDKDAVAAFPPQIALNQVAAHYLCPPGEDIIFKDQVVKLDVGVCYKGAIGDCAITVDLSGKYGELVAAANDALFQAQKILAVGVELQEIGSTIERTAHEHGYTSIKNLSGHGLGENKIHMPPTIPNHNSGQTTTLKPGMTFAMEPFVTDGKGLIYDAGNPTIFSFKQKVSVRSPAAKELLTVIQKFNGLPFSIHNLIDAKIPLYKIRFGLMELLKADVLTAHAPLVEQEGGMVAQAENSILIDDDGNIFVTTHPDGPQKLN